MIPDGNVEHVANADAVLIALQPLIQRQVGSRYRFYATHFFQQHRRDAIHLNLFVEVEIFVLLSHFFFALGRQV
ncbi:hypothetical protein D3C71_2030590 [compost metagenome]